MTKEMRGRLLKALKEGKIRWMPGMRGVWHDGLEHARAAAPGEQVCVVEPETFDDPLYTEVANISVEEQMEGYVPDLADVATVGCLLWQARAAQGEKDFEILSDFALRSALRSLGVFE